MLPKKKQTRPPKWSKQEIFDGILYPLKSGCNWGDYVTDDPGLIEMLSLNIDDFKAKPVNIPRITILIDHGYHLNLIIVALQVVYPQIMTKVRFERSPKPSKAEKKALGKSGFVPVATRWVVERSNAWSQMRSQDFYRRSNNLRYGRTEQPLERPRSAPLEAARVLPPIGA